MRKSSSLSPAAKFGHLQYQRWEAFAQIMLFAEEGNSLAAEDSARLYSIRSPNTAVYASKPKAINIQTGNKNY